MCGACRANTLAKQVSQAHYEGQDENMSIHLTAKGVSEATLKEVADQLGPQVEQLLEKYRS